MPFIDEILSYSNLSIVGMEKNTGKTECLNYILKRLNGNPKKIAITSIGTDGENLDQVTASHKPEIEVFENMIFITSEKYYRERKLLSEIWDISERKTSMGRLVTAKVINPGKVILSGPTTTNWLKQTLYNLKAKNVDLTIVDGALSRKTQASPLITQSMILTTGTTVSPYLPELIRKTKFYLNLLQLPQYHSSQNLHLEELDNGLYAIDNHNNIHDLEIPSTLLLDHYKDKIFLFGCTIFVTGIISDNMLNFLRIQKQIRETVLIAKDFTKLFISPEAFLAFTRQGGQIKLLLKNKLIALCVNPTSPTGYSINPHKLCSSLNDALKIPVYDIVSGIQSI